MSSSAGSHEELGSSVSIVSDNGLGERGSIPGRGKGFFFPLASVSRPAARPTQPPIQWVLGVKRGRGVTLTYHPYLVSRSRMSRGYIFSPPWRVNGGSGTALRSLLYYFTM
jgi:hypothetical protein